MSQPQAKVAKAPVLPALSAPRGLVQRKCACGGSPGLSGECDDCRKKRLQRKPATANVTSADAFEREADRVADAVTQDRVALAGLRTSGATVQRQEAPEKPREQPTKLPVDDPPKVGQAKDDEEKEKLVAAGKKVAGELAKALFDLFSKSDQGKHILAVNEHDWSAISRFFEDFAKTIVGKIVLGATAVGAIAGTDAAALAARDAPSQDPDVSPSTGGPVRRAPKDEQLFALELNWDFVTPPTGVTLKTPWVDSPKFGKSTPSATTPPLGPPPPMLNARPMIPRICTPADPNGDRGEADARSAWIYAWLQHRERLEQARVRELLERQKSVPRPPLFGPSVLKPMFKRAVGAEEAEDSDAVAAGLHSAAQPLDAATRSWGEPRFGHDFSAVRVHTGAEAAGSARALNALAYTVGSDIVFGPGQFSPGTVNGQKLLAHELTHVVQQSPAALRGSISRTGAETEADAAASCLGAGAKSIGHRPIGVHRAPLPSQVPLTDAELLDMLVHRRGFAFSPSGPPVEDPKGRGLGVGPQAGGRKAGDSVFAIVQVTDRNGQRVAIDTGEYFGGGDKHAEQQALGKLERDLVGKDVEGGELLCVVDQDPCGSDRKNCGLALEEFANRHKLRKRVRVPARPKILPGGKLGGPASPKTAARGAQRKDFAEMGAGVELEDFPRVEPHPSTAESPKPATNAPEAALKSVKPAPTPPSAMPPVADMPATPPSAPPIGDTGPTPAPPVAEAPNAPKGGAPLEPQAPKATAEPPKLKPPTLEIEPPKIPPDVQAHAPKAPNRESGLESEPRAPQRPSGATEPPKLGRAAGGLARGLATEAAVAGFGVLMDFAFLAAWLVDELVITPFFQRIHRWLAEGYRAALQAQIDKAFADDVVPKIWRVANCSRDELRRFEAARQKPYANVKFRVLFEDKTDLIDRALREGGPESIFDLKFLKLRVDSVAVSEKAEPRSSGELVESKEKGDDGPVYERSYTVSGAAPTLADVEAKFGTEPPSALDCKCFIATACFGSPYAPEVVALRRFRDLTLARSPLGNAFIRVYYRLTPVPAGWLARHPRSGRFVRATIVGPLAAIASRRHPYDFVVAICAAVRALDPWATRQRDRP